MLENFLLSDISFACSEPIKAVAFDTGAQFASRSIHLFQFYSKCIVKGGKIVKVGLLSTVLLYQLYQPNAFSREKTGTESRGEANPNRPWCRIGRAKRLQAQSLPRLMRFPECGRVFFDVARAVHTAKEERFMLRYADRPEECLCRGLGTVGGILLFPASHRQKEHLSAVAVVKMAATAVA